MVAMRKKQKVQIIYIGCVSQHHPDKTYALKLRQMVLDSAKELVRVYERR